MKKLWQSIGWLVATVVGSTIFAAGFSLFMQPNDMNAGGISGLAMVIVEIFQFGSVGTLSVVINLPLFLLGGMKIGKRFFFGSLLGMAVSSLMIDLLAPLAVTGPEPILCVLYGGVLCGLGLGIVFVSGASTGGSDILIRLLKLRYRNAPIGQISLSFDMIVVVLTGLVFHDLSKALYTGIAVFVTSKVIDAVVYRFDYSKVALIVSEQYEQVALAVGDRLGRGATYLYGQGSYYLKDTKVVLTAVKKQQVAELKEMVTQMDPNAFIIVMEAHQVLGDGFARYTKQSL